VAGKFAAENAMQFIETIFPGTWLIEPAPAWDSRGCFTRTFCAHEFAEHGLEANFVQHSSSYTVVKGTLRGMHFQHAPHSEIKVVGCRSGAIWDVIIDLRAESPTYRRWLSFELTAGNRCQLYIPVGLAHGFQALCNGTEVHYLTSAYYEPSAASGVRYDDPAFAIDWPLPATAISDRDAAWPDFDRSSR
jgi:dTDP-4-dehydrorhamnose 3,5-epimerase